jgi:hypothetical protein
MKPWLVVAAIVVGIALLGYGLHRAALWAERKGWIYYRNRRGRGVNLGFLDQIYQPAMEHVIEEETQERTVADQAESGDDAGDEGETEPGSPPDRASWIDPDA